MSFDRKILFFRLPASLAAPFIMLVLALSLSACNVQPLNKPSANVDASGNAAFVGTPQNIEIPEVNDRISQQVRNELIFGLNGGAAPQDPIYRLEMKITATELEATANPDTGDATSTRVTIDAAYTLREINTSEVVITGFRAANASIDQRGQSFADQRALRDAENRAAKEVAEQIRIAILAYLAKQ